MAVDLNAIPLTKTFVAPSSKEMADALAAFDARVPLGATDMEKAVDDRGRQFRRRVEESAGGRLHRRRPQPRQSAGHRDVREAGRRSWPTRGSRSAATSSAPAWILNCPGRWRFRAAAR